MDERICDICGRSASELAPQESDTPLLKMDEDGLWLCTDCQKVVNSLPMGEGEESELDEELRPLIGKSAGAICYSLDLPYIPPYDSVIDHANKIAYAEDRFMSAWTFVTQWLDSTTIWFSLERNQTALVYPDGSIVIRDR
jgi:hypothetical protein